MKYTTRTPWTCGLATAWPNAGADSATVTATTTAAMR
jgi:hypothetical protein